MKVKLKELCEIQSGGTPNRSNKQYWDNGTINWAKISDIKDKYLFNTEEKITEEGLKNSSAKLFKKNSILYTIFATLGEACILGIDTTTNQAIANLEIRDKNVETEYIYYYLLSKKKLISGIGRGVAQNNINLSILKEMEINLADITTQKRIVDILNQNESIINKFKKQSALLDTLIKARFVEMFGDPIANSMNWEKLVLKDLTDVRDGTHESPEYVMEGYPFITSKNISNGKIDFTDVQYISAEDYNKYDERSHVDDGDILMPMIGTIGGAVIVRKDRDFSIKNVALIKFNNKSTVKNTFIQSLLNSNEMIKYFATLKTGGTQKFISLGVIRDLPVINPPLHLQNEYEQFVHHIDKLKFGVQKSLEKTQMLFDSLMQQYFGYIDL